MNASEMHELPKVVERQHLSENPPARLFVPYMRQDTAKEIKRKIKRAVALTVLLLSEIAAGALGGAVAAAVFMPMAFAERGYHAYGGEWLLIFLAAALSYRMFHNWLFGKLEE